MMPLALYFMETFPVQRHFDVSVSFKTRGCTAFLASGMLFVDICVQFDCFGVKQGIHLFCYQICNSSILEGHSDPQAFHHWHHWRDDWRFVPLPTPTTSTRSSVHTVAPSVLSALRHPPPPPLGSRVRHCTPHPPLVPSAILAPLCAVAPSSTFLAPSTARLPAMADRPLSCSAAKALAERGVTPPLGGISCFLLPSHDAAANRRQRRPWRGSVLSAVSASTSAFSTSAAGAAFLGDAGGARIHGGAGGFAGLPLWVSASDSRQSPG